MTVVISEVMRNYYANLFPGNNYYIARNAAYKQNIKKEISRLKNNSSFTISYTGNLELGRWKILAYLAKALKNLNEKNKSCKVLLNIYSQIRPSDKIIKNITNEYSKYLGNVSGIKLNDVRLNSDILLFVESFNPRYKEILESALSTKIPEYLSYGRNILAIAPPYSWSLQYLHNNNAAYCIKNVNEIGPELEKYLKKLDQGELQSLIDNGLRIFLEKHEFNSNAEKFKDAFDKSISKWKRKNESRSD